MSSRARFFSRILPAKLITEFHRLLQATASGEGDRAMTGPYGYLSSKMEQGHRGRHSRRPPQWARSRQGRARADDDRRRRRTSAEAGRRHSPECLGRRPRAPLSLRAKLGRPALGSHGERFRRGAPRGPRRRRLGRVGAREPVLGRRAPSTSQCRRSARAARWQRCA